MLGSTLCGLEWAHLVHDSPPLEREGVVPGHQDRGSDVEGLCGGG